jgi:hypothetical protein
MKVVLLLTNGFTILNGLLLTLFAFSTRRGCDLLLPELRTLFNQIMCFPTVGSLSPILVIMPFVVASVILHRRGQATAAMIVACLPAVTFLLLWMQAASQPFGFGG